MSQLGDSNIAYNGISIIDSVLWQPGVLEPITIFTSTISAGGSTPLGIYDPPDVLLI
jgi:hypothetical protein